MQTQRFSISLAASASALALVLALAACSGTSTPAETPAVTNTTDTPAATDAPAAPLPSAESILARAVEVSGGADAYKAINNYSSVGILAIPAQKIEAALTVRAKGTEKFLLEIKIPGIGNERMGFDGTTTWAVSAMTGSRVIDGIEANQLRRTADFASDVNWQSYYKSAKTTGTEDVNGSPAHVVEMVDNDGLTETRFYDVKTGFMVRQKSINKGQSGEQKIDSSFSDFAAFGALTMPKVAKQSMMGMDLIITINSFEINGSMDDALFALPDQITKLVEAK